ncbi:hypothetical protein V6N12_031450 [Hibiscus sabdariffa]|uniref:RNase H type-1 domain-containing protein n=1 Tax=Hibiscus sabdariffa TaxID=183260 RepID=A0ABR1ZIK8_9ROSI
MSRTLSTGSGRILEGHWMCKVKKSGKISKFGLWEGIVWRWHIPLRRPLFDWEIDQLNDFLSMLAEVKLGSLPYDRLCWVKASTGCYTTKDMCKLLGKRDQDVFDRNTIWEGLAPFKVECFSWKLLHGRLPTNALLLGVYGAGGVIYGSYNVYFLWNPKPSLPVGLIYAQRVFDNVALQLGWWCQAKWPRTAITVTDLVSNPKIWCSLEVEEITVNRKEWGPPSVGSVEFNTDGAVKGCYGPAGIGGVLRDHNSRILMIFSKHIRMSDPVSAEILAIKEALVLFTKSAWASDANLIIETDCSIVAGWLQNPTTTPLAIKDAVEDCLAAAVELDWKIVRESRANNALADLLAKDGINALERCGEGLR